jgi:hypothetical protein
MRHIVNQQENDYSGYPNYLQSYEALSQYVRSQLDGLTTTEKGFRFAQTVRKAIPQTEVGMDFNLPAHRSLKFRAVLKNCSLKRSVFGQL